VTIDLDHTYRGDLEITLLSPDGTQNVLANPRPDVNHDYRWTFTTNRLIGEQSDGQWTLRVRDLYGNDVGTLNSWKLTLHGTSAQAGPNVLSQRFEYDARQAVSFTFDAEVGASLTPADLVLRRNGAILDAPR